MLFNYQAIDEVGAAKEGTIDAVSVDVAIASLQRRGLTISTIHPAEGAGSFLTRGIPFFDRVSNREMVILSRQIATLFEAQVSALRIFQLLASENDSEQLKRVLVEVSDDIQSGNSISKSLGKHPKVFSDFYVNMVRAGEESGKLDATFIFLADHLDRTYEITSKARNALIYPAFVIFTFVAVMVMMLTIVIPKISTILLESGQEIPIYTKIIIGISSFFVDYGILLAILLVFLGFFLWRFAKTEAGKLAVDRFKLGVPFVGSLYQKLYLSRIADNLNAMLTSGISMVRGLEITQSVVGNKVYEDIIRDAREAVKAGSPLSSALSRHPEMPSIMVQMFRVGEETGELGSILEKLAKFYRREVGNAVDTLVNLIEPFMIVGLGLGVGILLAAVLIPIYNISGAI